MKRLLFMLLIPLVLLSGCAPATLTLVGNGELKSITHDTNTTTIVLNDTSFDISNNEHLWYLDNDLKTITYYQVGKDYWLYHVNSQSLDSLVAGYVFVQKEIPSIEYYRENLK